MASISKKAAGLAAAGAAVAAIGLGASQMARADDATPTPNPSATSNPGNADPGQGNGPGSGPGFGPGGRHGGMGLGKGMGMGAELSTLATKLGVDETKLKDALKAVRDELRAAHTPGQGTAKPDPATMQDELATKLASKLGLDAAKVKAAFTDLRATADAARQKAFDDKLAKAVTDGTLTQAEADAVKKAAKAGVIGMGGPR
ncbi:hypothetical protein FHX52_1574 [Humibacillus xanthopallidus]|uniref:ClpA/ClpB-like protein n=1 Tax=Humibacillus xanthopallidus TaxID=412689 RepID=A0A543PWM6_9MICO|nr:hypothetical protein [Humibacillus xanthopallidus]TQN48440.1 hypothetical protein FHX52_1574 [Humibacillus xanthopallidus]